MKKFKQIFYPIYILAVIFVLLVSFNIYDSLELFKKWGWFRYFSDLPYMVRDLMVFLSLLMVVELVLENIQMIRLKGKISEMEDEITRLKARLFDKSEEQKLQEEPEEDEEKDDDDYLE